MNRNMNRNMKNRRKSGFTLLELILSVALFSILMLGVGMAMSGMTTVFSRSLRADRAYAALANEIKEETVRGHATGIVLKIEFEIGGETEEEVLHQYRAEKDGFEMEYYR